MSLTKNKRKSPLTLSNDNFSGILQKIRRVLKKQLDSTDKSKTELLTYKHIRSLREEFANIKRNFQKFFTSDDLQTIKKIEKHLEALKQSQPWLVSKESYLSHVQSESQLTSPTVSDTLTQDQVVPMEIDEELMKFNEERSMIMESYDIERKQPVESTKAPKLPAAVDESSLNTVQKLYMKSLELWQCIEKLESNKDANIDIQFAN